MAGAGRPGWPVSVRKQFWEGVRSGLSVTKAAAVVGVSRPTAYRWFGEAGGMIPETLVAGRPRARLTHLEREQIAMLRAGGSGVRTIAARLGRPPSTISRELRRNTTRTSGYLPSVASSLAFGRAKRPKPRKLAPGLPLTDEVWARLRLHHSPVQIERRLRLDYPNIPEMHVSHETIYQTLYVQARGALREEVKKALRSGRAIRRNRAMTKPSKSRIRDMVMISERPAEVEDRAVPGHWEGDLILGAQASNSAIGTLVERTTGTVLLLHLPGDRTSLTVANAMIQTMSALPEHLRRSVTWDQGIEMARHKMIAAATDMDIYFCDPHSPWQRGSNENTNGLLRQYFPKSTDLSIYTPEDLARVAAELNDRPRKRHDWLTPAEVYNKLLLDSKPPRVASTT